MILCFSSEVVNLSLSISPSFGSELFCDEFFETLVILSAFFFPFKSPVPSPIFWTVQFEAVLITYEADCLAWSRSFWLFTA